MRNFAINIDELDAEPLMRLARYLFHLSRLEVCTGAKLHNLSWSRPHLVRVLRGENYQDSVRSKQCSEMIPPVQRLSSTPYGRIIAPCNASPEGAAFTLVGDVPLGAATTLYSKPGDWLGWLSLAWTYAVEQHPVWLAAFVRPGKEVGMRRQMISKTGYDDQRAKASILRRSKQVLKVTIARIREDHPGVLPAHIRTVLSFEKLDYQNPDLPDDGFLMDITFEKRN